MPTYREKLENFEKKAEYLHNHARSQMIMAGDLIQDIRAELVKVKQAEDDEIRYINGG